MKRIIFPISALALAIQSTHALEALDDSVMSQVSGQSGLTIEVNPGDLQVGNLAYTQDGTAANLRDLAIFGASGSSSIMEMDIDSDGTLKIDGELGSRGFTVGGVGMTGSTGISNDFFTLRGRTLGYNDGGNADPFDDTGVFRLNIGDDNGDIKLDGSQVGLFFDSLHFGDDGLEWIIDDLVMSATVNYGRLIVENGDVKLDFGDADLLNPSQGVRLVYDAKAIGLAPGGLTDGSESDVPAEGFSLGTQTFGSLRVDLDAYGSLTLRGGGNVGEGITFIPSLTLYNASEGDTDDRPAFKYVDDGYVILAKGFRGDFSTESGLTLDFETDVDTNEPYLSLRYSDLDFAFSLDDLVLGDENGSALGSFKGQVLFRDYVADDPADSRLNYINYYPGGRVGTNGLRADVSWNIVSADPEVVDSTVEGEEDYSIPGQLPGRTRLESNTYFAMEDDGNFVYFNGFNGYGSGWVTFDLTSGPRSALDVAANATSNGTGGYYANPYNSETGEFDHSATYGGTYEGLRIGFEDLSGEYSFAGVTVGSSEEEAMDAAYMGGTELLLAMEVFPAYSFKLNGNLTIAPGGQLNGAGESSSGSQGLTINGDLLVTEGSAALTVNEFGRGVWLTNVTYDIHMRGASLDVTEEGLTFNKGLTWSTIKVGNTSFNSSTGEWDLDGGIIFGSKEDADGDGKPDGKNLGVFTLERLEDGTTIAIASGGARDVCIGGTGATEEACLASGGRRFERRGDQGLTIKVNAKFAEGSDDPNSPYFGKGNRFSWTQANGTTLTLDNFSTSDGPQGGNDYGLNIDLALDVARTSVLDDDGNPLKLVNGEYTEFEPGDTVAQNGPIGFAVFGRLHFKQLNIDGLKLAATPDFESTPQQTLISEIVIQNADIQANLTATPIR